MAGGIGAKLTDKAVKAFVAKGERGKKLADGGGLHLFITPAGGTAWRIKYRIDGKEKLYSIGPYPQISLAAARVELGEVKARLLENNDPVTARRVNRASNVASADNTFQVVAREWLSMKQKEWSSGHHTKSTRALERDIYPTLGKLPISSITPAIVAKVIEDINKRDVLETATRILQHLNGVFRYAQAKGLCRDNPALAVIGETPMPARHSSPAGDPVRDGCRRHTAGGVRCRRPPAEIGIVADRLDALLQGDDLVVAGHHGHGAELQPLGEVHGADRDVAAEVSTCSSRILNGMPASLDAACARSSCAGRSNEHANLVRQDAGLGTLRNPVADRLRSPRSRLEGTNRPGRAVEHGNGIAAVLAVAIHVGHYSGRAAGRPACGSGARCGN
jgi:hypothetical protein